ncbi:dimethylallyl tryptophan synthase GliD1 [Melanomma pulvis-pyrius CBS 109.77]|uniref:Dimethylallyl tryptophan synthase GliD1 n=1 Tax=Melanomma pulvis-pyrius CBS 109.77 TaxID=1314802 RepID=A0A6A6XT12_9PLEO|nr:dimethylallyl tryptophan synthase GliD1 [Melanomma pulvis-pyrius CBS 109.77]
MSTTTTQTHVEVPAAMTNSTLKAESKTSISKSKPTTSVWNSLSLWLPSRNPDYDFWWGLTGPHLAVMLDAADYPTEKQYEMLLFHYHWSVPYLGPRPSADGMTKWKSLLEPDGSPIEYSWKWNTPSNEPDVRFTMEPINEFSGTALDPLNQLPSLELLHRLAEILPSIDLAWVHHFYSVCFDHDKAKYAQEVAAGVPVGTTTCLAFEFVRQGLQLKSYFLPRKIGQKGLLPFTEWDSAIRQLEPTNAALDALRDFLETSPEGKKMNPLNLAVDDVAPKKSRMKFYFQTPKTSFESVREIMAMGGRITGIDSQLEELKSLISAVTSLPANFPEDSDVPVEEKYHPKVEGSMGEVPGQSGYLYYFDIRPGAKLPEIKFYTPVSRYGRDDLTLAKALVGWMEGKGRQAFGKKYLDMLESMADHRNVNDGKGLQTYVSCMFKKGGELDITTYISPQVFHPGRVLGKAAH